jgi:hypothetical protein
VHFPKKIPQTLIKFDQPSNLGLLLHKHVAIKENAKKIDDKTINASNIDLTGTLFTKKRHTSGRRGTTVIMSYNRNVFFFNLAVSS